MRMIILIMTLALTGCLKESTTSVRILDAISFTHTFKGSPASEAGVMAYDAKTKSFGLVKWKSAQLLQAKEGIVELVPKDDTQALAWYRILNSNQVPVHVIGDPGKTRIVIPASRENEARLLISPPVEGTS